MPPQQGMFPVPYKSSGRDDGYAHSMASSSRTHVEDLHRNVKDKTGKRREIAGKLGKEMNDRRDDGRQYAESVSVLHSTYLQLCSRPSTYPGYNLRLYPLSLERSALLAQIDGEERYALDGAQTAYEEERERVEDEWKRGRERVRERLMEGIEERRRRAREEKEGEGIVGDTSLDSQSRPHITRKLRNKLGSPSPTPITLPPGPVNSLTAGLGLNPPTPANTLTLPQPFLNPHSLSVDELPSPFPLPLTATSAEVPVQSNVGGGGGNGGTGTAANKRKPKGGGANQNQVVGGLGKSLAMLAPSKEAEIEADLGEIRRGSKRRRAGAKS